MISEMKVMMVSRIWKISHILFPQMEIHTDIYYLIFFSKWMCLLNLLWKII